MRKYTRPYVGRHFGKPPARLDEMFRSATEPAAFSHPMYAYVIGPFMTARGARFAAENPYSPCQTVAEFERAAAKAQSCQDGRS